jgi:hypothetical protein
MHTSRHPDIFELVTPKRLHKELKIRTSMQYIYTMTSRWFHLKEAALALRTSGMSMTVIERKLGIPRSTLSGWFRSITLTEEQQSRLTRNKQDGWAKARLRAVESHRAGKALRLLEAKQSAIETLEKIDLSDEVLDLAFAMLYLGEGAKTNVTSLASSDPLILRFMLTVLRRNYAITPDMVRCDLHLRMDQDGQKMKAYWALQLGVPLTSFKYVSYDKRSEGKATYDHYKGVCVISCGNIAIQRKLVYLYNLFCEKVTAGTVGA